MGSFLYIRTFYPNRPWPGTHGPPSSLLRAAQRFERSENALDVVAGLSIIGLPLYHSVWVLFFNCTGLFILNDDDLVVEKSYFIWYCYIN